MTCKKRIGEISACDLKVTEVCGSPSRFRTLQGVWEASTTGALSYTMINNPCSGKHGVAETSASTFACVRAHAGHC
jgi:hypothetical protein